MDTLRRLTRDSFGKKAKNNCPDEKMIECFLSDKWCNPVSGKCVGEQKSKNKNNSLVIIKNKVSNFRKEEKEFDEFNKVVDEIKKVYDEVDKTNEFMNYIFFSRSTKEERIQTLYKIIAIKKMKLLLNKNKSEKELKSVLSMFLDNRLNTMKKEQQEDAKKSLAEFSKVRDEKKLIENKKESCEEKLKKCNDSIKNLNEKLKKYEELQENIEKKIKKEIEKRKKKYLNSDLDDSSDDLDDSSDDSDDYFDAYGPSESEEAGNNQLEKQIQKLTLERNSLIKTLNEKKEKILLLGKMNDKNISKLTDERNRLLQENKSMREYKQQLLNLKNKYEHNMEKVAINLSKKEEEIQQLKKINNDRKQSNLINKNIQELTMKYNQLTGEKKALQSRLNELSKTMSDIEQREKKAITFLKKALPSTDSDHLITLVTNVIDKLNEQQKDLKKLKEVPDYNAPVPPPSTGVVPPPPSMGGVPPPSGVSLSSKQTSSSGIGGHSALLAAIKRGKTLKKKKKHSKKESSTRNNLLEEMKNKKLKKTKPSKNKVQVSKSSIAQQAAMGRRNLRLLNKNDCKDLKNIETMDAKVAKSYLKRLKDLKIKQEDLLVKAIKRCKLGQELEDVLKSLENATKKVTKEFGAIRLKPEKIEPLEQEENWDPVYEMTFTDDKQNSVRVSDKNSGNKQTVTKNTIMSYYGNYVYISDFEVDKQGKPISIISEKYNADTKKWEEKKIDPSSTLALRKQQQLKTKTDAEEKERLITEINKLYEDYNISGTKQETDKSLVKMNIQQLKNEINQIIIEEEKKRKQASLSEASSQELQSEEVSSQGSQSEASSQELQSELSSAIESRRPFLNNDEDDDDESDDDDFP